MLRIAVIVAGLVTVVLAALALGLPWAKIEETALGEGYWHLMSVHADTGGSEIAVAWPDEAFDGQDGIGGLRASGPMWISALALVGLAVLAVEHGMLGVRGMAWPAFAASMAATILAVITVILMPLSTKANHQWDVDNGFTNPASELVWHAGLYLGVAMAVAAIATTVLALLAARAATHEPA